VVDDNSDDETSGIVRELASGRENEYVVRLVRPPRAKDKDPAPKKTAIDAGIRATDGSILIVTDADCVVGPCWIRTVVSRFDTDVVMVSGPVGYTRDGTWFGDLQRLEFAGMVAIGGGSIEMGWPLLCSGANIAYRREAFESIGGFEGIDHIGSGDDDLLMEKMHEHTPLRIRFCADPAALTWTAPSRTFGRFVQQRIRWASKGRLYASASKRLLLLAIFVFLGFVAASPVVAYLWPDLLPVVVAAWAAKIVADALILSSAVNLISGKKLLGLVPVGEIVHAAYVVAVGLAGTAGGYSWKGRRLLQ
jgi:cellulose synthase/poly-beta-1,6-N-acetylglucosamine synthase-like glycosyltransferase